LIEASSTNMTDLDVFTTERNFTRRLTLDLLESLSDAELGETPGRGLGPFWKQFRHVGRIQECYLEGLRSGRIKFDYENKRYRGGCSKDSLKAYLLELDRELARAVENLDWHLTIDWDDKAVNVFQHLMWMVSHETLHHGQWIVYARLMEKKMPPGWKAWGV
jgi:uncharacterized damage-inducible protein DinB